MYPRIVALNMKNIEEHLKSAINSNKLREEKKRKVAKTYFSEKDNEPLEPKANKENTNKAEVKKQKEAKSHISKKSNEPSAPKVNKENINKALIAACREGNVELTNELIKAGADLSVKDHQKNDLLKIAITMGHDEIAIQLIKNRINLYDLEPGHRYQKTDELTLSLKKKRYLVSKYLVDSMNKDNDSLKKALKYSQDNKLDNMVAYLKDKGIKGEDDTALENFPGVYYPREKDHGSIEVKLHQPTKYVLSINTNRSGEKCSIPNIVLDLKYDSYRKEFVGKYIENGGKVKIRYWYSSSSKEWLLNVGADYSLAKTHCAYKGKKGGFLGFVETRYYKDGYKKK